jgi:hypothetical protein
MLQRVATCEERVASVSVMKGPTTASTEVREKGAGANAMWSGGAEAREPMGIGKAGRDSLNNAIGGGTFCVRKGVKRSVSVRMHTVQTQNRSLERNLVSLFLEKMKI